MEDIRFLAFFLAFFYYFFLNIQWFSIKKISFLSHSQIVDIFKNFKLFLRFVFLQTLLIS